MYISIAIPCYKSSSILSELVSEIEELFLAHKEHSYEIILVNDGSPDNTFETIYSICEKNPRVTGISLSKNFGQSAAKMAALPYVNGEVLVFMDDDGQHPAEGIIALVEKISEGYDLVYAKFSKKEHSLFKRITSSIHGWLLVRTGSKAKDISISSFNAFSSFSIQAMKNSDIPTIALGPYVRKLTDRIANVEIEHKQRRKGRSGYTLNRLLRLWLNAITSFNTLTLRIATVIGIGCGLIGLVMAVVVFVQKLIYPSMAVGYASTMVTILVLCGLIMLLIGILGEYIGKMYLILCGLPPYKIRTILNARETRQEQNE